MKSKICMAVLILLSCQNIYAQLVRGTIKTNDHWKKMVYLIEIDDYSDAFSGSSNTVADSFMINGVGSFRSSRLKNNTLYRLNAVPENADNPGSIIQDGANDNYAFFATDSSQSEIIFTADIASLFRTYRCLSSNADMNNLQRAIMALRDAKIPVYDKMNALGKQMDSVAQNGDSSALSLFKEQAIAEIAKVNGLTRQKAIAVMDASGNANVISLGLILDGVGYEDMQDEVLRYKGILKRSEALPLQRSILETLVDTVDLSFLSARYKLLDDAHITMDSLRSRYILLDFWASWCVPCRQSIRTTLKEIRNRYDESALTIIGVNTDETLSAAIKAIKEDKNTNRQIGEAAGRELTGLFKVTRLPTYVLIDAGNKKWYFIDNLKAIASYLD